MLRSKKIKVVNDVLNNLEVVLEVAREDVKRIAKKEKLYFEDFDFFFGIAKNHLLVVVFFNNTELNELIHKKADNVQEIYDKVIAEKFAFEKRLIVNELRKYGIYSVLTQPENLTLDTINKYLEIKARGIL